MPRRACTYGARVPRLARVALALALACPWPAAAASLRLHGLPAGVRGADAAFAAALARPGDSLAVRDALGALLSRLQSAGHLRARAEAAWDPAAARLDVRVEPGPVLRLAAWRLDATPGDSAAFAPALDLGLGEPADPARWDAAIARALAAAEAGGHPYAMLGVSRLELQADSVHLRLVGDRGPAVTVDSVIVRGLTTTRRAVVERALGRQTALAYDPARARAGVRRLERLGLFSRVTYEGLEGAPDWRYGRLTYRVEEPRYNQLEAALGVQGDAGLVGLARLELGNVAGSGRRVGLSWQSRGRGLTDFAARGAEPFVLGTPVHMEVSLVQSLQDTIYTRTRFGVRAAFPIVGDERAEAGYEGERVVQPVGEVREASLQNTTFALEHDGRDDPVSPRRGWRGRVVGVQTFQREVLRATGAAAAGRRRSTSSAAELALEWHHPFRGANGLALEWRAAGRFSTQRPLPDWQRYPVGGAGSLRGHDEEAFRVDRYALTRLEFRRVLGRGGERAALFWDQAWMETEPAPGSGGRRRVTAGGAGFGLRLPAAGGLVELDYGLQPGRAAREGRIHLKLVTAF